MIYIHVTGVMKMYREYMSIPSVEYLCSAMEEIEDTKKHNHPMKATPSESLTSFSSHTRNNLQLTISGKKSYN